MPETSIDNKYETNMLSYMVYILDYIISTRIKMEPIL